MSGLSSLDFRLEPSRPSFPYLLALTDTYQIVELKLTADNITKIIGLLLKKREFLIEGLDGGDGFYG